MNPVFETTDLIKYLNVDLEANCTFLNTVTAQHQFLVSGLTSGQVAITAQDDAGFYAFNLPTTAGTAGQVLTSGGGGSAPMTWTDGGGGGSYLPLAGGTMAGDIDMDTNTISNVIDPVSAQDVATKAYVDAQGGGIPTTKSASLAGGTFVISPATFNPGTGDFAVSLWLRWDGTSPPYQNLVGANDVGFTGNAGYIRVWGTSSPSNGKISSGTPSADADLTSNDTVAVSGWSHVVVTRTGTTLKIYINGVESASKTSSINYDFSQGTGVALGNSPWDGANGIFSGDLAEVQFYNAGLSAGDVTALYNDGRGVVGTGAEANLVAGYHLNATTDDYGPDEEDASWSGSSSYVFVNQQPLLG